MFLFVFVQLAGSALAGFGIYVFVSGGSYGQLGLGDSTRMVAYVLIILGSIIMLLGFLGCCGALLENKCMLVTVGLFNLYRLIFVSFTRQLA